MEKRRRNWSKKKRSVVGWWETEKIQSNRETKLREGVTVKGLKNTNQREGEEARKKKGGNMKDSQKKGEKNWAKVNFKIKCRGKTDRRGQSGKMRFKVKT